MLFDCRRGTGGSETPTEDREGGNEEHKDGERTTRRRGGTGRPTRKDIERSDGRRGPGNMNGGWTDETGRKGTINLPNEE